MANWSSLILTNKGKILRSKVEAGQTKLTLTKIKLGDGVISTGQTLEGLLDLVSPKQIVGINSVSAKDSLCTVTGIITNVGLQAGYNLKELGLFATDPDVGEILYAVTTDSSYDYLPAEGGATVVSEEFSLNIGISNLANVTAVVDMNGLLTVSSAATLFNEKMSDHNMDPNAHSNLGINLRKNSKTYVVGDVAYSLNLPTWARLDCIQGGTTANTEPTWGTVTEGQEVTDGTVKWRVSNVRDNYTTISEATGYGIISGGNVTVSEMIATVNELVAHMPDGLRYDVSQATFTIPTADVTNPRIDLLYLSSAGIITYVAGTATSTPSVPTLPSGALSLATISVLANATTGTVTDTRVFKVRYQNTGIVNPKDFGAKCDGITDDTKAYIAALIYRAKTNLPFYIPPGNSKITKPLDFTRPIAGITSSGYLTVFGMGKCSIITYYPPVDGASLSTSVVSMSNFNAGAINFGNTNNGNIVRDFVIKLGGTDKNNSCGIKSYDTYQGLMQNVEINGFSVGLYAGTNWSDSYRNIKVYNCTYGAIINDTTINMIDSWDINNCNIGILFGWNSFGLSSGGYTTSFNIKNSTFQNCREVPIIGINSVSPSITSCYFERNCAGSYDNLFSITNNVNYNGCELIFISRFNGYGNTNIDISNNSFIANLALLPNFLGVQSAYNITVKNNHIYKNSYTSGITAEKVYLASNVNAITTDTVILGGIYDSEALYQTSDGSLPYLATADLSTVALTIPANSYRTIVVPFNITKKNVVSRLSIKTALSTLTGLSFTVGYYAEWESQVYKVYSKVVEAPTLNTTAKIITFTHDTLTFPTGQLWAFFELQNTTASDITFNALGKVFDYANGEYASSVLNSPAPPAINRASVSSIIGLIKVSIN